MPLDLEVTGVTETPGGSFSCHFACVARFIFTTLPPPELPSLDLEVLDVAGVKDTDPLPLEQGKDVLLLAAGVNVTDPLLPDPFQDDDNGEPLEICADTAGVPPLGVSVTDPVPFGEMCF